MKQKLANGLLEITTERLAGGDIITCEARLAVDQIDCPHCGEPFCVFACEGSQLKDDCDEVDNRITHNGMIRGAEEVFATLASLGCLPKGKKLEQAVKQVIDTLEQNFDNAANECPVCGEPLHDAMIAPDGTNLEQVKECTNPECPTFAEED